MKIAIAYTQIYPPITGASGADRRVRDIARGLNQDNNEIIMYVPEWQNSGKENTDSNDFNITYLDTIFSKLPFLNRLFFWKKLVAQAKKDKVEAVIFYTPTIDSLIAFIGLKRKGIIVTMEFCDMHSSTKGLSLMGILLSLGEKLIPKYSQTVFVISSFLEDFIKKHASYTPTVILPILVDPNLFEPSTEKRAKFRQKHNLSDNDVLIAYVGGMYHNYGVDHLIESFSILIQKTNQNVKLLIAGRLNKQEDYVDAENLVEKFNLKDKVILTGWADTEMVNEILNAADILTVPHHNDTLNKAGLPTKLAEYSCIGKAIVASSVGDVDKYFTHRENAFLTEGSNLKSLSNGLLEVVENKELRDYLSKNARKTALSVFDYKVNGEVMINVLKKLKNQKI